MGFSFNAGAAASGLLGGIGSIISGSQQVNAQREANKANLQIAQMNNEFNERMVDKQQQYNVENWQRQADYDSASQQVARFREAGINPYLAMTGGASAGMSSGINGTTPAVADTSGTQMPVDYSGYSRAAELITNSLQNAVSLDLAQSSNRADIAKKRAETESIQLNNDYFRKAAYYRLAQEIWQSKRPKYEKRMMMSMILGNEASAEWQSRQNELFDVTYNDHVNELRIRNQVGASQAAVNWLEREIRKEGLPYVAPRLQIELAEAASRVYANYQAAGLSAAVAKNATADYMFKTYGDSVKSWKRSDWRKLSDAMFRETHYRSMTEQLNYYKGYVPNVNAGISTPLGGFNFGFGY